MAAEKVTLGTYFGSIVVSDSDADENGKDNVTGAASTVHLVQIDNTSNSGTRVFFKMYDAANPTIGTDAPDYILPVQGGAKRTFVSPDGFVFSTAVSYACVTGAAKSDTTAPSSAVSIVLIAV